LQELLTSSDHSMHGFGSNSILFLSAPRQV